MFFFAFGGGVDCCTVGVIFFGFFACAAVGCLSACGVGLSLNWLFGLSLN
jgi:hypothetical protein